MSLIMSNEMVSLYSKNLFVTIRNDDKHDRRVRLTISVEIHNLSSPSLRKELFIRLTEESDVFFLYTLVLGEDDFQCLKNEQGLLVDFAAFPQKLIDLIELCLQEEYKDYPKFLLSFVKLHRDTGFLNVVETNPFKHLTHLSLKFIQGSDIEVKKYLATCLKDLKDKNGKLENALKSTEAELKQRLFHSQECVQIKVKELEHSKSEYSDRITSIQTRLTQDLEFEKEKHRQIVHDLQLQYELEKRDLEFRHNKSLQHLEERVTSLDSQVKMLSDKKSQMESTERDLRNRLVINEDELTRIKREASDIRQENSVLNSQIHETEKIINSSRTKIDALEQTIKDKDETLKKQEDLTKIINEEKEKLAVLSQQWQAQILKQKSEINESIEKSAKANRSIRKLEETNQLYYEKMTRRKNIAITQEMLIREKEALVSNLKSELSEIKANLKTKENELDKLKETEKNISGELDKTRELRTKDKEIIDWLNKQLNEKQLALQKGVGISQQFSRPMHISPITNIQVPGIPSATSTPQNFGYLLPNFKATSTIDTLQSTGKVNKENTPPFDAKYLLPNYVQLPTDNKTRSNPQTSKTGIGSIPQIQNKQKNRPVLPTNNRIPKADILASHTTSTKPAIGSAYFT